ncbi:MAG: archease [Gammaproteobacteria bacterium]|nr:archease [Gammaproteobacteria bacterium]
MSKTAAWEHVPHGADIGVRGRGATLAEAFENAALALTAVITDPESVRARTAIEIACAAPDRELLLVDWLNAVVFEMATRQMLFARFDVTINNHSLAAKAFGEPVCRERHHPAVEVKGATLTGLAVRQLADNAYSAECIVDV